MFEVLLESRHVRPPRPVVATVFSTAFHAGLVALVLGGATVAATSDEMNPLWDKLARFLAPPNREGGAIAEKVSFVSVQEAGSVRGTPGGAPVETTEEKSNRDPVIPQQIAPAVELSDMMKLQVAAEALGSFTEIQVDSAAERDPLSAGPAYPKAMLEKQIEGSALMRFVIDSTGLIDLKTIAIQKATHPDFAKAVEDVMPRMHFRPALMGSKAVRQLVEQEFKFQIKAPVTASPVSVKRP
jgi:TonB family protein